MPGRSLRRCTAKTFTLVLLLGWSPLLVRAQERGSVQSTPRFVDVTASAGLLFSHGYIDGPRTDPRMATGGVAAGDFDGDQLVDLYVVTGDIGPNFLFRNRGDGTFEKVGEQAGVRLDQTLSSGPVFADFDGDGWEDLFVGAIEDRKVRLFRNLGNGTFQDVTEECGISAVGNTFSSAFGDYDRDGDLDVFLTHWTGRNDPRNDVHLWRNNGDLTFTGLPDLEVGLTGYEDTDYSFTPNFVDIDGDGWSDLLVAGDFRSSKIFLNKRDGTFENITTPVISDDNGMGAAVGDYDNDGDMDWFVSSIFDPEPGFGFSRTGNRLYRNLGDGTFEDVTSEAGVREGFWGWGSCFADFDNDGQLDLFHTNGFVPIQRPDDKSFRGEPGAVFHDDPSRLFISNGDGTFTERSEEWELVDTGQGRGVVCFDYDRDGDLDIFVSNNSQQSKLYRNDGGNKGNFLNVRLTRRSAAVPAAGARISVTVDGVTQLREWRAGSNYVSQQPQEVHFGLGDALLVQELRIVWPDGEIERFRNVPANRFLVRGSVSEPVPTLGHRSLFTHAPSGGGVASGFTLVNTNHGTSVGGRLAFYDQDGGERLVTIEGLGTASSFMFGEDFLAPGGSRTLEVSPEGSLKLGIAVFESELPVSGVYRFRFGDAHIGVPESIQQRAATVPILTTEGFNTGLSISNPGDDPLWLRLVQTDGEGLPVQSIEPPELNPLPAKGLYSRFLTEDGFPFIAGQNGGTIQILVTEGGPFTALSLAVGGGRISTTPVVSGAAGVSLTEAFQGTFSGTGRAAGKSGSADFFFGVIESSRRISLRLEFSPSAIGLSAASSVTLFGTYGQAGFTAEGVSASLGAVTASLSLDGTLLIEANDVPDAGVSTISIEGIAFPDRIEAATTVTRSDDSVSSGELQLRHTGR